MFNNEVFTKDFKKMTLDLSLSTLGSIDSYDRYMQSIRTIPSLTAEEEMALGMRLKKSNDLEAAKTLILSHLKLVAKVAKGYSGYGLPQSDLVQEGNIGLMKAVKRFDPERGVRLVSFAIYWIKAEIQEYIVKNWRLVKTATTKAQRKLFFNLRSMKKTLQPLKSDEINSIAKELNVKPEDVREMEYRFNGNEISLDYGSEESEDDVYLTLTKENGFIQSRKTPEILIFQDLIQMIHNQENSEALESVLDPYSRVIAMGIIEIFKGKDVKEFTKKEIEKFLIDANEEGVNSEKYNDLRLF